MTLPAVAFFREPGPRKSFSIKTVSKSFVIFQTFGPDPGQTSDRHRSGHDSVALTQLPVKCRTLRWMSICAHPTQNTTATPLCLVPDAIPFTNTSQFVQTLKAGPVPSPRVGHESYTEFACLRFSQADPCWERSRLLNPRRKIDLQSWKCLRQQP